MVGLTDEERDAIFELHHTRLGGLDYRGDEVMYDEHFEDAIAAIYAKLKQKNGYAERRTHDKEALKLALEALQVAITPLTKDRQEVLRAITAIKEALAQTRAVSMLKLQSDFAHRVTALFTTNQRILKGACNCGSAARAESSLWLGLNNSSLTMEHHILAAHLNGLVKRTG